MSTVNIPIPKPLNVNTKNLADEWKFFRASYENFEVASGIESKDLKVRIANLLTIIGADGFKLYKTLPLTEKEKESIKNILDALEKQVVPKANIIYERFLFNAAKQENEESIEQFIQKLRQLSTTCQYGEMANELIRDKIVFSVKDEAVKKQLLMKPDLTLTEAINTCQVAEHTGHRMQIMKEEIKEEETINLINKTKCKYCSYVHETYGKKCPAFGKKCNKCGKMNHFSKVCNQRTQSSNNRRTVRQRRKVAAIQDESDSESDECLNMIVNTVNRNNGDNEKLIYAKLKFKYGESEKQVKCFCDTGSTCNVIGMKEFIEILGKSKPKLTETSVVLKGFGGNLTRPIGSVIMKCQKGGKLKKIRFQVVEKSQMPLLSANTCQGLDLIKLKVMNEITSTKSSEQILDEYPDIFEGDGKLEGEVHLEVDSSIKPTQQHPRRIPVTVRKELKELLADLEKRNIVEKVEKHTEWTSNCLIVRRKNKLRLCIDPFELNKALKRSPFQIPTIEEILPELNEAKVFSTLDAKNGFWQLTLDDPSSYLTTFWTTFGRYRWKRVPFGISPAPEIYQKRQKEILQGLSGVEVMADDILVYGKGKTKEEAKKDHDKNLRAVLQRARECNMKLNRKKARIGLKQVTYFSHILTSEGLKADPEKVKAVLQMQRPENVKEAQCLLGMVTYLAKFLPNLSEVCEPIRKLTRKDTEFKWDVEQQIAFEKLRKLATDTPVLRFYDVNQSVQIECDASSIGLGATLKQNGQPIMYVSRTLTTTERKYAQIEKECLAIVHACSRFDQYLCGKTNIEVETDHQPLINICNKPLINAPKRLQRMMLRLQRYDIKLKYKKGKEMYIADLLSRKSLNEKQEDEPVIEQVYASQRKNERFFVELRQINALEEVQISDEQIQKIRLESAQDPEMQALMKTCQQGWPNEKTKVNQLIKPYWKVHDELTIDNGIVLRSDRIIIPIKLRAETIKTIHYGHVGIESSLRRAREAVYWPSMNDHIKNAIQRCEICLEMADNQRQLPLQSTPIPDLPFQRVNLDICEVKQLSGNAKDVFLIISDSFSDWIEVEELKTMSANVIITACKRNFSRHGIPSIIVADSGTQFYSKEFLSFAKDWGCKVTLSSPYHHQGNGKSESAVKIVKRVFQKADKSRQDRWLALLEWRNTTNHMDSSPAQRLYSRRLRTKLPIKPTKLRPELQLNVPEKIVEARQKSKYHHDKRAKKLPDLEVGTDVYVQMKPEQEAAWSKGQVTERLSSRKYRIQQKGRTYTRNRQNIKTYPKQVPFFPRSFESTTSVPTQPVEKSSIIPDIAAKNPRKEINAENDMRSSTAAETSAQSPRPSRVIRAPQRLRYDNNFKQN